jgi:hypothetical protein
MNCRPATPTPFELSLAVSDAGLDSKTNQIEGALEMEYTDNLRRGILGGLAGGIPFGLMMGMMGMLPMIGAMVGLPSAVPGFLVHMMMSAGIGAGFGLFLAPFVGGRGSTLAAGLGYGAVWWVLGPLTFMPWIMGMGFAANLSIAGMSGALPSLVGHLVFGAVLGATYVKLGSSDASREFHPHGQTA